MIFSAVMEQERQLNCYHSLCAEDSDYTRYAKYPRLRRISRWVRQYCKDASKQRKCTDQWSPPYLLIWVTSRVCCLSARHFRTWIKRAEAQISNTSWSSPNERTLQPVLFIERCSDGQHAIEVSDDQSVSVITCRHSVALYDTERKVM